MGKVILTIRSQEGTRQMLLPTGHTTIGRGEAADVTINDRGLSRVHASIHSVDGNVWILDESSTNGCLVNGRKVPATGAPLSDRDEIKIGDNTTIMISLTESATTSAGLKGDARNRVRPALVAGSALVVVVCLGVVFLGLWILSANKASSNEARSHAAGQTEGAGGQPGFEERGRPAGSDEAAAISSPQLSDGEGNSQTAPGPRSLSERPGRGQQRLYRQMTPAEQAGYVEQQARHVADMIGKRPCTFTPEVLNLIKYWVDAYSRRVGNNQAGLWREDLRTVFKRATRYTPIIIREFRRRDINEVIGVYIPMIETEYNNICYENRAGAMGLFQFTGPTARGMGLDPGDRCDVKKMTPIAARYIADRLSEFGTDAVGVSLSIAGYNRSPDSVRRDLYNTIDPNNRERSFWTLVANKGRLDEWFQTENIAYVPRFFAAAIIGENPWDFGVDMNQLSTYTVGGDGD